MAIIRDIEEMYDPALQYWKRASPQEIAELQAKVRAFCGLDITEENWSRVKKAIRQGMKLRQTLDSLPEEVRGKFVF